MRRQHHKPSSCRPTICFHRCLALEGNWLAISTRVVDLSDQPSAPDVFRESRRSSSSRPTACRSNPRSPSVRTETIIVRAPYSSNFDFLSSASFARLRRLRAPTRHHRSMTPASGAPTMSTTLSRCGVAVWVDHASTAHNCFTEDRHRKRCHRHL